MTLLGTLGVPAQTPTFTYQGRLNDTNGPVSGTANLTFRIFNAASGGAQLWQETTNGVSVAGGYFAVELGTATLIIGPVLDGSDRWLEIAVNGATLTNRQKLTHAPYSIRAREAGTAVSATTAATATTVATDGVATASLQDNAVTSGKILDGTVTAADVQVGSFSNTFWKVDGNAGTSAGTHFLGTTDTQPMELRVNNQRALRISPTASNDTVNVVGGSSLNYADPSVIAVTIAGGGTPQMFGEVRSNSVASDFATVGGGIDNQISLGSPSAVIAGGFHQRIGEGSADSTIGGGANNTVRSNSWRSTVSGGFVNQAAAPEATVAGGAFNNAVGVSSTIGGGGGNSVGGDWSTVAGGRDNTTSTDADYAAIGGGWANTNNGSGATLGGGFLNYIESGALDGVLAGGRDNVIGSNSWWATIAGGRRNRNNLNVDYGAIGGGRSNTVTGSYATVAGGWGNLAHGSAAIGGGEQNTASALYATIAGGRTNTASKQYATAGGGNRNTASGFYSTIAGGDSNTADSGYATIGGGQKNFASADHATVAGGAGNTNGALAGVIGGGASNTNLGGVATIAGGQGNWAGPNASYAAIAGGNQNQSHSQGAFIGAGENNVISDPSINAVIGGGTSNLIEGGTSGGFIGGGSLNLIGTNSPGSVVAGGGINGVLGPYATIGGGYGNSSAERGTVAGGEMNASRGYAATVPGGSENLAQGAFSLAAGRTARALHDGAFVWADSSTLQFQSSAANQFNVRASGGVRFETSGAGMNVDGQAVFVGNNGSSLTSLNASQLTSGTVSPARGGIGLDTSGASAGSILRTTSTGTWGPLPAGTSGQVLKLQGGLPAWGTDNTGSGTVTSVDTGLGLLGGPVTTAGSISIDPLVVPRLAVANTFTGTNSFLSNVGIGTTAPTTALTVATGVGYGIEHTDGSRRLSTYLDAGGGWLGTVSADPLNFFVNNGGSAMIIDLSSRVGIGRTPTANALEVNGDASKNTAGSWLANSDARIKQDIQPLTHALDTLGKVRVVSFRYTDNYREKHASVEDRRYLNVVAQEFQQVFPDHVKSSGERLPDGSEVLQVDTYPLTIYSAAAIQELNDKVEGGSQKAEGRIQKLEAENSELKRELHELKQLVGSLANQLNGGTK